MRWLFGSIPDWDALFVDAYRTLKPGGWVESGETSLRVQSDHVEIPDNSAVAQWGKFFIEGGEKVGRSCMVVEEDLQSKGMEKAGFVDIKVHELKVSPSIFPIYQRRIESWLITLRRGLLGFGLRISA